MSLWSPRRLFFFFFELISATKRLAVSTCKDPIYTYKRRQHVVAGFVLGRPVRGAQAQPFSSMKLSLDLQLYGPRLSRPRSVAKERKEKKNLRPMFLQASDQTCETAYRCCCPCYFSIRFFSSLSVVGSDLKSSVLQPTSAEINLPLRQDCAACSVLTEQS